MRTRTFAIVVLCLFLSVVASAQSGRFIPDLNVSAKGTARLTISFENGPADAISGYSFGVTQVSSTTGGGGGAGRTDFSFNFTKDVSSSSPGLFLMCANGNHIKNVDVQVNAVSPNGTLTPFLTIKMSDVLISSYSQSGGGDRPTESLSLNFTKVTFTTTP